jgi:GTPase SAR1 family protein
VFLRVGSGLVSLHPFLGNLACLRSLDIFDNPLLSPPASAASRWSVSQIQQYCRSLSQEGAGPLPRIRLMFVGAGGVGKTTLCRAVTLWKKEEEQGELEYLKSLATAKYESTHGIDVCHWKHGDVTFNVWDFAGQPEYYGGHQQFLADAQAIYVVVYRTVEKIAGTDDQWRLVTREETEGSIRLWLSAIRSRLRPEAMKLAGVCPAFFMVVGTHLDKAKEHRLEADVRRVAVELEAQIRQEHLGAGLTLWQQCPENQIPLLDYIGDAGCVGILRDQLEQVANICLVPVHCVIYPPQVLRMADLVNRSSSSTMAKNRESSLGAKMSFFDKLNFKRMATSPLPLPPPERKVVMPLGDLLKLFVAEKIVPCREGAISFVEVLHSTGDVIFHRESDIVFLEADRFSRDLCVCGARRYFSSCPESLERVGDSF